MATVTEIGNNAIVRSTGVATSQSPPPARKRKTSKSS